MQWFLHFRFRPAATAAALCLILSDRCAAQPDARAREVAAQRRELTARGLKKLADVSVQDRKVALALSYRAINSILGHLRDIEIADEVTGAKFIIKRVEADFAEGFPRISASIAVTHPLLPAPVELTSTAALAHEWIPPQDGPEKRSGYDGVRVEVLDARPTGGNPAATAFLNADFLKRINARIPVLPLPIPRELILAPTEEQRTNLNTALSDLVVKLPNGKLHLALSLAAWPVLRINISPELIFGDKDGLHMVALATDESLPAGNNAQTDTAPSASELNDLLKEYQLPDGKDVVIRVPSRLLVERLGAINRLPVSARTIKLVARPENHILDRTGGPPAGNGFESYFDGEPQGSAVIQDIQVNWIAGNGVKISAKSLLSGTAKIHFHGHSPKIAGRSLGGGNGKTVDGRLSATPDVEVTLTYDSQKRELLLELTKPDEVRLAVHTGGIIGELINLLNVGLKFRLPLEQLELRYSFGSFEKTFAFPSETVPKNISIIVSEGDVKFLANQLEASAALKVIPANQ